MAEPNVVTKEDLVESAKRCIVEKGINKLTLKSVGEGAGVTQGTVYYHFKTKDKLMIEIVNDMCESSWNHLENVNKESKDQGFKWIKTALQSAYERHTKNSFYHHLFLSLITTGLNNDDVRGQMGDLLKYENEVLQKQIQSFIGTDELYGISTEIWSVLWNALIDGLAIQTLMVEDLDIEKVYEGIELLLVKKMDNM
ncbi:AcrR family transcriptional regulator [Salibacterium salarium]|uniref:TetR/AcrR family transcriptional regulator n=1 Tax=Salibacterium salarium TaxID=284579 RepID=UPI002784368E|nr:TetR/AcrR family transcriptional regulator [Salibacterium salarium]MDQ0300593.1 AcrR family transcriptional regulator [Salibacterium salarium]